MLVTTCGWTLFTNLFTNLDNRPELLAIHVRDPIQKAVDCGSTAKTLPAQLALSGC